MKKISIFDSITSDHIDALQEIGNIGSGHSANALAELLNRRIDMSLPRFKIIKTDEFNTVKWFHTSPNETIAAILCKSEGVLDQEIIVAFDQPTIFGLINLMSSKKESNINELSSFDKSLISEVGSILALHYITAINTFLNTKALPKAPLLTIDTANRILDYVSERTKDSGGRILLVECDIFTSDTKLSPRIILVPEEKTVETSIKLLFGEF